MPAARSRPAIVTTPTCSVRPLDEAMYEVLQREVFLSACMVSTAKRRAEHIGWRLVGRLPSEYAQVVIESMLEEAGFAPNLGDLVHDVQVSERLTNR